jgi:CRP/FNR family transcriptional regulator
MDVKAFLRQVPLFAGAPERALDIAAEAVQRRTFEAGAVLFREGDTGEALYILVSGLVKVSKVDLEGHEKTLAIFQAPEVVGEMALLGQDQRSATALALSKVETLVLYRDDFLKLLTGYPVINLNLTSTLAQRLRGMDDEAQILSYKDAQGRVAYVLLRLYRGGVLEFNKEGQAVVRLTHQELASLAGTSRETVTRALKALEEEQVIQTRPKEVLISDPDGLEEILHGIR